METIETGLSQASLPPLGAATAPPKVVIVDIGERQLPEDVKQLRSGQGKLIGNVERIVADLVAAGTISATAQPVVFVVREMSSTDEDDDDDEDDL